MRTLWAFFRRDLALAASYRLELFVRLASVLSLSFTFFFLSSMVAGFEDRIPALQRYGGRYFGFALVGLALSSFLDAALRSFSASLRQAQMAGTFAAMLQTRAALGTVVAGSALYTLAFTAVRAGLFLGLGVGLFGMRVDGASWGVAVLVLALTVLATLVLGIFAAGFVVRFKQGDPVSAGIAGLSWLLSGVVYPKEILPLEIQRVAELLPLTHSLEAMRLALLSGASLDAVAGSVRYLGGFVGLGAPLALLWFGVCVRAAKRDGALAHY